MRERLWILFGLLLGLSFAVQVAMPVDVSESPETTFETAPRGYAALFDLLGRYASVKGRWLSGLSMPPTTDTVWWIAASGICDDRVVDAAEEGAAPDFDERRGPESIDVPFRFGAMPWIESGGTAIVWLSHPPIRPFLPFESESSEEGGVETREVAYHSENLDHASRSDRESALDDPEQLDGEESETRDGDAAPENEGDDPEAIREEWQERIEKTRRSFREGEARDCVSIAGHPLPARQLEGLEGGEIPPDAEYAATAFSVGRLADTPEAFDWAAARTLPGATLAFFESAPQPEEGWHPLWVEASDQMPFALERRIGEGRLIVVADARVLTNARLGRVDSAPFVFDWVRDWGVPWIDEHRHGIVPESGVLRYVATSPAWAACVGLLVLGALFVWRGNALPTRHVEEVDAKAPTLATFVDSLSRLYADTDDHARASERYRSLSLDRIRRALGLSVGTPAEIVVASLRARAESRPQLRERGIQDLLTQDLRVETAAELERAAARLDELVRTLKSENGPKETPRHIEM